ncbi:hypothetical protein [Gemmobacter sp. 24YEA27]|uniref:hypothetical protein n=1 Tax=Gemmobacter sp. 24YEA27 TaxID=3040672 RepID=UPI0024B36A51|nr:hypothetical protein [Gemmobacter sp. 24YEA27]
MSHRFVPAIAAALLSPLLAIPALAAEGLPLQEGYYVEAGEECGSGNDATLIYLHAGGFNNRYGMCSFEGLTSEGGARYSYAVTCAEAETGLESLNEGVIEIRNQQAFHLFDGLMDLEYSFCPSSELPPPYGD